MDLYQQKAHEFLGSVSKDPVPRALRISGIYASFYLRDPFLFRWFGLACFVSKQIHRMLTANRLHMDELLHLQLMGMLADGNLEIYSTIVPASLRFLEGAPIVGGLEPGFDLLSRANTLALQDEVAAETLVQRALESLCQVEQRDIVQPYYTRLPNFTRMLMSRFYSFRMGYDSEGKVMRFRGTDPANPDQRCQWMEKEILPAFNRWRRESPEQLRADCDRLRRDAGVRNLPI